MLYSWEVTFYRLPKKDGVESVWKPRSVTTLFHLLYDKCKERGARRIRIRRVRDPGGAHSSIESYDTRFDNIFFRTVSQDRVKWNMKRPWGTKRKSCMSRVSGEKFFQRLKNTKLYVNKPWVGSLWVPR